MNKGLVYALALSILLSFVLVVSLGNRTERVDSLERLLLRCSVENGGGK